MVTTLDEALRIPEERCAEEGECFGRTRRQLPDIIPELAERGVVPDILTDQTSAHDPLNGYVRMG